CRDIALLRDVDAPQVADTSAVRGVVTGADVEPLAHYHRRRQEVRAVPGTLVLLDELRASGVTVELPDQLVRLERVEGVQHPVPTGEDDQGPVLRPGIYRVRPLPLQDFRAGRVVGPDHPAGVLVDSDETRRGGVRERPRVRLDILAVAGDGEHQVADDQRRADSELTGEDLQLLDHIDLPDELRLAGVLRVAVDVGADQLAAVTDVVDAVAS